MHIQLGHTYRDKITGFTGIATGYVQYLTGCNQALLAPKCTPEGGLVDSHWFDQQRLQEVANCAVITLDNGPAPGFDKPAPKC